MEKVIALLRDDEPDESWCRRLRGPVADDILTAGIAGLTVNVRDGEVRDSLMTLTTLDPPVVAVVSLWTQQSYGEATRAAIDRLGRECGSVAAYLVTESVPLAPPPTQIGERTTGLANVALLRRPATLDPQTWLARWQMDHTQVAIDTQATFGYTQNPVVRPLTAHAPPVDGIVEELFPAEAISDLTAFFGANSDDDLKDRMQRMIASTSRFGANANVDTVPTSRYVLRSPFL